LLSSHILSEVEKMCDRSGIMLSGEIVETGSLSDMRHLTRTVIQFQTMQPTPDLKNLQGVYNVTLEANGLTTFSVDSDKLSAAMDYLADKQIELRKIREAQNSPGGVMAKAITPHPQLVNMFISSD